jgi:hypothetical protein
MQKKTYFWYADITEVEGSSMKLDKHIMVANLWERSLLVPFQAVKAICTFYGPGFGGFWSRHDC